MQDLYLAIDVGTGGLRSALVDVSGKIHAFSYKEHDQIVPRYGWSEQRPRDWWTGTVKTIRKVTEKVHNSSARITAICACGQMHGSVLIDSEGNLTRDTALLWNDKRTAPQVERFVKNHKYDAYLKKTANIASTAWPAFKLQWLAENDPQSYNDATTVLMPKDYIAFRLTGERYWDWSEASMSFLMDANSRHWSDELLALTGLRRDLLPPIKSATDILAPLSKKAARETGLREGIPVLVGGGDYPVALLGSGVCRPGIGSDVTGTSSIITVVHKEPVLDPEVSNVATVDGGWGSFALLDAGGDAVRWARRAFHENRRSFDEISEIAVKAQCGSNNLLFLPYLNGERIGSKTNSRAQFFGLTAGHGLAELHRAVLEGVAFSVRKALPALQGKSGRPERFIAASGGAKSELWLKIKASMYDTPYLVPEELECGVIGAACMMAVASGDAPDLLSAVDRMVTFTHEILPDQEWKDKYDQMAPVFERLYFSARDFYDDLDSLDGNR